MTHSRFDGLCIIDADTHLTEPHDLWTARAPKGYEDRVPQVHEIDGIPTWTMDGHTLARRFPHATWITPSGRSVVTLMAPVPGATNMPRSRIGWVQAPTGVTWASHRR